ncbi:MAG: hypothetical protein U0271_45765 [Polyangiaceae bacterium]
MPSFLRAPRSLAWVLALAGLSAAAAPSVARADLPPPDGTKYVGYEFSVENLAAFPDYVLIAFPTSMSNGAPTRELAILSDGMPVPLGRRSDTPSLYLVKKADFDVWKATRGTTQDALDESAADLVKTPLVIPCDAHISPTFSLPDSDKRETVSDKFRLAEAGPKTCHIVSAAAAKPESGSQGNSGTTSSGDPDNGKTKKSGGCAGCAIDDKSSAGVAGVCAAIGALAVFARRRRKR